MSPPRRHRLPTMTLPCLRLSTTKSDKKGPKVPNMGHESGNTGWIGVCSTIPRGQLERLLNLWNPPPDSVLNRQVTWNYYCQYFLFSTGSTCTNKRWHRWPKLWRKSQRCRGLWQRLCEGLAASSSRGAGLWQAFTAAFYSGSVLKSTPIHQKCRTMTSK